MKLAVLLLEAALVGIFVVMLVGVVRRDLAEDRRRQARQREQFDREVRRHDEN